MSAISTRSRARISAALAALLALSALAAPASAQPAAPHPSLDGFDDYLVFLADGFYEAGSPHPNPAIAACGAVAPGICDGDYFHEVIMGRTPGEIAQLEQQAKAFFLQRFGLDANDPNLLFMDFMIDPRINYRARTAAGRNPGPDGWTIDDGGFLLIALNPTPLGGGLGAEFPGTTLPAFSFVLFGNYKVNPDDRGGPFDEPIIIDYQSNRPMQVLFDGAATIQCRIFNAAGEEGQAQGIGSNPVLPGPGGVPYWKFNWRNVLTFPPLGMPPAP